MNLTEIKDKLNRNNVPVNWYSLNEGLKSDACILHRNYSEWEFFYLDEKGERHDYTVFDRAEDAYDHLWKKMEYQLRVFKIKPIEEN